MSVSPVTPAARSVLPLGPLRFRATTAHFGVAARALEAALRRRGGRTQSHPVAELFVTGTLPNAALATFVLESDRIARAVVSEVRVPPFMVGIAVVIHPRADVDAPLLVADFVLAPTGRARALLDAAGPAIASPGFAKAFAAPLARVVDGAAGLRRSTVPPWLAPLSGGGGGTLRAGRGESQAIVPVLLAYVETYLDALEGAARSPEPAAARANGVAARAVRDLARSNGPAKKWLVRAFGEQHAERYMRLLWREG